MKQPTDKLRTGNITDIGLNPDRPTNQDYYGTYEGLFGSLFIVCDGMGGHAGGDKASRLTVEEIKESIRHRTHPFTLPAGQIMVDSIERAHQKILDYAETHPEMKGMGTTLVMLLIKDDQYWYACVGDSRIYLKRNNEIIQLTKDHSVVQGMVDAGIITQEQALEHPDRNRITRALGSHSYKPDISGPHQLYKNDVFLLCTDGLHQYFKNDNEVSHYLDFSPLEACQKLVELAKTRGGSDNITMQIVQAASGDKLPAAKTIAKYRRLLPVAAGFCLIVILLGLLWRPKPSSQPEPEPEPWGPPPPNPSVLYDKFNEVKERFKIIQRDDKNKKYFEFCDQVREANGISYIDFYYFDSSIDSLKTKIAYIIPNKSVLLLSSNRLSLLNTQNDRRFSREDMYSIIIMSLAFCQKTSFPDNFYQVNPYLINTTQPISRELINDSYEVLDKYLVTTKSPLLDKNHFNKSIDKFKSCLNISGLTMVYYKPHIEAVTPKVEKPSEIQKAKEQIKLNQENKTDSILQLEDKGEQNVEKP